MIQPPQHLLRAYLGGDEYLDEPAEVVILCPTCAEREFGSTS